MVPMIVRVENISDRLSRRLAHLRKDLANPPRRVRVDQHHVVSENHPARVRRLPAVPVAIARVNSGRELADPGRWPSRLLGEGHEQQRNRYTEKQNSSHAILRLSRPFSHMRTPRQAGVPPASYATACETMSRRIACRPGPLSTTPFTKDGDLP